MRRLLLALCLASATSGASAAETGTLLVWTHGDGLNGAIEEIGRRFTVDTGIPVAVESPGDVVNQFQKLASMGDGPDIIFHTHDNFGVWAAAGLIFAVEPDAATRAANLDVAWSALDFDGATWGWPLTIDVTVLYYNREFVAEPPADFAELGELDLPAGVAPILWEFHNIYYSMPLLMANGGYVFGRDAKGTWNPRDTGVANAGARLGASALLTLIGDFDLPGSIDFATAQQAMLDRRAAMTFGGQWDVWTYRGGGLDVGIAPLPAVNGSPAPSFVGVQAFAISAASPNAEAASRFIEDYLVSAAGLATFDATGALMTVANRRLAADKSADPDIEAAMRAIEGGVPMSPAPAMSKFWAGMGHALDRMISGRVGIADALDAAAARILAP